MSNPEPGSQEGHKRVEHLGHSLLVFKVTEPFPKPFP